MTKEDLNNLMQDFSGYALEAEPVTGDASFWAVYNGLVTTYLKNEGLSRKVIENIDEMAVKVMILSINYAFEFNHEEYQKAIDEYVSKCPALFSEVPAGIDKAMEEGFDKVISVMVDKNKFAKNSGINIDKSLYEEDIYSFRDMKKLMTPDLFKMAEEKQGQCGIQKVIDSYNKKAETSAMSEIKYYRKVVEYLCSFYANIKLAKNIEEQENA